MSKLNALMEDSTSLSIVQQDDKNLLKLMSDDKEVSSVELPAGSGTGGFELAAPTGATAISGDEEVTIKWSDPTDVVLEGVTLAKWDKTIVVRKEGTAPQNAADGVVILEETTRNQYASTGYTDTGLENGKTYYYGIFPHATSGATTVTTAVLGSPRIIYPSAVTGLSVSTAPETATVTFTKPADATRCDLVYKKGSAPTSSEDGTKISNVTSGKVISGLVNEATYYFVVYTYNAKNRETASSVVSAVIKAVVEVPSQNGTLTYTGSAQTPAWNNYDSDKLTIGGTYSGTNAGTYNATFTPKGNYVWEDGTNTAKTVSWTIDRAPIADVPSQNGTLTFTGNAQSPTWNNYNSSQLTIGGATSGTNATSYTATFTPTANYKWSDGSTTAKNATWSIGRATIAAVPSQSGFITYNGTEKTPSWNNYNTSQLTIGGTTKGTNAGSYNATFTPTSNYKWSDGSTTAKTISWTIGKAVGSASLSKTSTEINISKATTDTVTVTRSGDGAVSASSSNNSIATVSVSGTTVTITGKTAGSATITVKVAAGTNHTAPADMKVSVTVKTFTPVTPSPDASLDDIVATVQGHYDGDVDLSSIWNEGDTFQIDIAQMANPNEIISSTPWPAQKMTLVVCAFNHHDLATPINGKTKAAVTLQCRECLNSTNNYDYKDSAFVDGDSSYDMSFKKWSALPLRSWLNGAFKNALPAALKNAIKPIKHNMLTQYNQKTTESVTDSVFLPTYPEIFGNVAYGNYLNNATPAGEEGTQWEYFKTASNRIKYRNNNGASTGTACAWWEGSASSYYYSSYGYHWCLVHTNGDANYNYGNYAYGVAPAFCL